MAAPVRATENSLGTWYVGWYFVDKRDVIEIYQMSG